MYFLKWPNKKNKPNINILNITKSILGTHKLHKMTSCIYLAVLEFSSSSKIQQENTITIKRQYTNLPVKN